MNKTSPSNHLLHFTLFFSLLMSISIAQTYSLLQQNCPTRPVPQKFGILTTTYIRLNSTKMINHYLQQYAESDCEMYDNIYIVWNNEETPEEMGVLKNAHKWKKNVYFMQTIENSLDFKYIVPTWAKQKSFFSMDDDFDITCQTLRSAFSSWQKLSYGEVAPLASFYARSYVFSPETQSFTYIDQIKLNPDWKYYHFGLTGISFISRHFLEMYYSDIFQIKEMRKLVVRKNNCEDLLLNFMINYLYPQLVTQYLNMPFKSLGKKGVSTTKTHKEYRAQCITQFSQILGFNPIRYITSTKNKSLMQQKTQLNQKCLVNLKQQHYEKNFMNNKAYYLYIKRITGVNSDFIKSENQKLIQAKQDIYNFMKQRKQEIDQLRKNQKITVQIQEGMTAKDKKILQQVEMGIHFGSDQQIESYMKKMDKQPLPQQIQVLQINDQKQNPNQQQHIQTSKPSIQKTLPSNQTQYMIYLVIFVSIIMCIFCVKKIIETRNCKYQTVPVSNQL